MENAHVAHKCKNLGKESISDVSNTLFFFLKCNSKISALDVSQNTTDLIFGIRLAYSKGNMFSHNQTTQEPVIKMLKS